MLLRWIACWSAYLRTSGGRSLAAGTDTPTSCSQSVVPAMTSNDFGLLISSLSQSLSFTVALTVYRPGLASAKQGATSTRRVTILEDSTLNSPCTGKSVVIGTT